MAQARGTTVVWRMWRGDPAINAYVDGWVAPRMRDQSGVTVEAVEGQGPELVNTLATEREALAGGPERRASSGSTAKRSRSFEAKGCSTARGRAHCRTRRSSTRTSSIISRDFEQDPAGYESPWGMVQFALIYDSARTPEPPTSIAALAAWIQAHPGRFTHDQQFTGITFLKSVMYGLAGGVDRFQGGFDEQKYQLGRDRLFAWLSSVRSSFWRNGATYPPDVAAMHRLFANSEIDFTMSNNQNEVVTKVRQKVFPPESKALLLDEGTIANAHYVGIPFNAPNAAGAMVLANFLISPEAQLEKQRGDVWGDGTVLDVGRLPAPWPSRFDAVAKDAAALPRDLLTSRARPEVHPLYHARLLDDWRGTIRRGTP